MQAPDLTLQEDLNVEGVVFDLQRFALHDGPGIRTTVFLKGCPLSCVWCHNPESRAHQPQLAFDATKCTNCLECVAVCPTGALYDAGGTLGVNHALCDGCGRCIEVCPTGALRIIGETRSVSDIIDEVERDRAYYERSGGGFTVSGGEPLARPHFARALLREARRRGLHTCLDTSGAVSRDRLDMVIPFVDLFLYDYKGTDPAMHLQQTGVSNDIVLDNLAFLLRRGARVNLRCPLVPGVNDSKDHLRGIAAVSASYPELEAVEIMAYHDMGKAKAEQIGYENPLRDLPTTSEEVKSEWLETLHGMGCERATIG